MCINIDTNIKDWMRGIKIMNLNSIVNITWMFEETSIVVPMHLLAATPENAFNETETVE